MNPDTPLPSEPRTSHKNELLIGSIVTLSVIIIGIAAVLFIRNSTPKIIYQPANACDMFTLAEARQLLGPKALNSSMNKPTVSGNTATSRCGYADGNPDTNTMIVAAIIVRSGINDKGVEQNKSDFARAKPSNNVETVKDLGNGAYFNQKLGQLNVLSDHEWIIISYGTGISPESNAVDQAVALAHKVLR